jgi:hypothetical protein
MPTLTDRDLKVLTEATALLPEHQRTTFTRNVSVLFAARGDLVEAIRMGLASFGIAVGKAAFTRRAR